MGIAHQRRLLPQRAYLESQQHSARHRERWPPLHHRAQTAPFSELGSQSAFPLHQQQRSQLNDAHCREGPLIPPRAHNHPEKDIPL
jgi:hypothetical protein